MIEQKVPVEEKNGIVYYSVKKMWYDGNGNVIKEKILTNSAGESDTYSEVIYTYDNRNNLVMTESNDGEESNYTQYYYDAKGNTRGRFCCVDKLEDRGTVLLSYDDEGRLISKTIEDKDMGIVQNRYTYDKRGNVISIETGMGI